MIKYRFFGLRSILRAEVDRFSQEWPNLHDFLDLLGFYLPNQASIGTFPCEYSPDIARSPSFGVLTLRDT